MKSFPDSLTGVTVIFQGMPAGTGGWDKGMGGEKEGLGGRSV